MASSKKSVLRELRGLVVGCDIRVILQCAKVWGVLALWEISLKTGVGGFKV